MVFFSIKEDFDMMHISMKQQLTDFFTVLLAQLGVTDVVPQVFRSENASHGDYTTNVAMVVARQKHDNPITIANKLKKLLETQLASIRGLDGDPTIHQEDQTLSVTRDKKLGKDILQDIEKIEVVPPGFINIFVSEAKLSTQMKNLLNLEKSARIRQKSKGRKIMVEYAHPNTHKAFHIGHLRNITTGECMVRLLKAVGNTVIRANYQGDIGLHIAKCLYGILHTPNGAAQVDSVTNVNGKVDFLANTYVKGSAAYEKDTEAKLEIERINKQIYAKDPSIYALYQKTRQWSLDYFETIYKRVGTHFDRYYFESETYENGKALVLEGEKRGIFVNDKGTVIFPGEKYGLHNRVFITGEGNPTYEAKDMGLAQLQFAEKHPDLIIHCVGSEQTGYFQVIIEALAHLMPETKGKEYHLVYGWVRLKEGKMSSRTGQVILGEWLLDNVKQEIKNILLHNDTKYSEREQNDIAEACAIAAVKYSFLKVGTTQDIAFDIKESININGDSGPYLLYSYARCRSVLRKAEGGRMGAEERKDLEAAGIGIQESLLQKHYTLQSEERAVLRHLLYFSEIVEEAAEHFAPNMVCTYLFALSQVFNQFYATCPILEVDDQKRAFRLLMVEATAETLAQGLHILGIPTIERM